MTSISQGRWRRGFVAALLGLLVLPLGVAHAQDQSQRDPVARLADLDLTEAQAALVRSHLGEQREPGALWGLAAALAPTLTDDQKAALLSPPERPQRRAERKVDRSQRFEALLDDRASRREQRAERQAAAREAMRAALALTPEQVQALESQREQRREARRAERPAPGQLPAGLADVLTAEQQEVWRVHHGLALRLGAGPRR